MHNSEIFEKDVLLSSSAFFPQRVFAIASAAAASSFFFFFNLASFFEGKVCMRRLNLSSPASGWNPAPCIGSRVLTTGLPGILFLTFL